MKPLIIGILIVLVVAVIFWPNRLVSVHVINMDKSVDRWAKFQAAAARAGIKVTRWRGVNGAELGPGDLLKYNISREIYDKHAAQKRLGVLGCYLSHMTLLRALAEIPCGDNDYHVIFEDDAVLEPNFRSALDGYIRRLPSNWDVLQMNIISAKTKPWSGPIHTPINEHGNWGTGAYAVRHGALSKINAHIAVMRIPIDDQLLEKKLEWRWFSCVPNLVETDDGGKTTLND
jgi:GR25 family glycosyltransferase involved in LPS biosynthesis